MEGRKRSSSLQTQSDEQSTTTEVSRCLSSSNWRLCAYDERAQMKLLDDIHKLPHVSSEKTIFIISLHYAVVVCHIIMLILNLNIRRTILETFKSNLQTCD